MEFLLKKFRRAVLTVILAAALFAPLPARAVDPVTIMVLAPIALKGARIASPYVIQWMQKTGAHMLLMGKNCVEILCLPLGVVQCTIGAPFGYLGSGIDNIGSGLAAPFKLTLNALYLPFSGFW